MRSKLLAQVIAVALALGFSGMGLAQPKSKTKSSEVGGDKSIEKQSAWEQKVMGEDSGKKSDLKKIAAAQKLADAARKNPPPIAAPKVKDPSKEGVRAKQEASIGLPIASDEAAKNTKKRGSAGSSGNASVKKGAPTPSSESDELGSLVASSLAEDRVSQAGGTHPGSAGDGPSTTRSSARSASAKHHVSGRRGRVKSGGENGTGHGSPGALDQLFAAGK